MDNTIESLFVNKYLELEKENKDLRERLEQLRNLFAVSKLEYVSSSEKFIRSLRVFTGENLESAVIAFMQNDIPVANIKKYWEKEEEKSNKKFRRSRSKMWLQS